ncbi:MAG: HAMP domain-containing histidine kinase, partial [Eubacterium sp.]|nr:HAMP domain-containing histidine kinase [Eubacterium sp.]
VLFIIFRKTISNTEKNEHIKTAFTSAAAHELKTPLSVIENQCECIMENVAPEKNAEYINSIYTEALRMNKLVASLLQYNRLASADKIKMEKCRLDEIVQAEIEKYQTYFSTKNIRLETEIYENAKVKCNAELISLVIDNYLSNAVKHTNHDNTIKISLIKNNNSYRFSVYNEGKNIPYEYKDMLFNVLYKTDKSRNRDDNSTGMGLAICKEILDQHKYKYGFYNKRDGVEFYFLT